MSILIINVVEDDFFSETESNKHQSIKQKSSNNNAEIDDYLLEIQFIGPVNTSEIQWWILKIIFKFFFFRNGYGPCVYITAQFLR